SVFLSAYYKNFIQQTGQCRCRHALNAHADTRDVRQSPTRPVGIVNNTDTRVDLTESRCDHCPYVRPEQMEVRRMRMLRRYIPDVLSLVCKAN
ncbi:MAG: hypothetical protein RSB25_13710, partial [Acinetobacter sp.]